MAGHNRRWTAQVSEHNDALQFDDHVVESDDPRRIAASLKRSEVTIDKHRAKPFRSAMSKPTFFINRAGKNLPAHPKASLQDAKDEWRRLFYRDGKEH